MIKIISILLISSALAAESEPDCATNSTVVDDSFNKMAIELSRTCNSAVYQTSEKMCECLEKNKLVELRVPDEQKKALDEKKIEKSIGKTLKFAIDDLLMNTTKFKNLNLRNELHDASKEGCSPQSIVDNIKHLEPGSINCPGTKEKIDERLKTIFGDGKIENFPAQYDDFNLSVDSKSCISRHNFLRLRSSNKRSQGVLPAFSHESNESVNMYFADSNGKDTVANLLTYDLFFSLGYKNPEFKRSMSDLIKRKYDRQKQKKLDEFLYTDPEALNIARVSLNESCIGMEEQLNHFLCSETTPELNTRNLSLALDDTNEKQEPENFHTKQYFMKRFSCAKTDFVKASSERFNNFYEAKTLQSRLSKDAVSDKPTSEYSVFNDMFCQGRAGQQVADSAIPGLMKDYFSKKLSGKPSIDLKGFFSDPANKGTLGLRIDPDKTPMISSLTEGLPEIYPTHWHLISVKLINAGMSFDEVEQLYGIIEMQTTARKAEVTSIQQQLANNNPALANITVVEVDGLLRGDPAVVASFRTRYPGVQDPVAEATTVYQQQNSLRAERFNVPVVVTNPVVAPVTGGSENGGSQDGKPATSTVKVPVQPESSTAKTPVKLPATKDTSGQTQLNQVTPGLLITNKTSSGNFKSGQSNGSGDQSNSSDRSFSSNSVSGNTSGNSRRSNVVDSDSYSDDRIRRLEEEISTNRQKFEAARREMENLENSGINPNRRSNNFRNNRSNYQFPKNVPLKSLNGEYSYPEAEGSELSSLSNEPSDKNKSTASGSTSMGGQNSSDPDIASASFGSGSGIGGGASDSRNRNPASVVNESDIRKELGLAPYEFYRYIPHSIFDVVGSIDKVVLLLGLEGKSFKTIEAIEEFDPDTDKVIIKYIERTYDFVPEGKFAKFKEDFSSAGRRIASFKSNFNYSRSKENIQLSKNYSLATKEIARKEVPHDYVLKIQNYILSDAEIKDTITKAMELLK